MSQSSYTSRLLLIGFFSLFAIIFAVLYLYFKSELSQKSNLPELPVLGFIHSIPIVDQDNKLIQFSDFKGDLIVLSFYSKNPNSVGQVINAKMLELQSSLKRKKNIRIVSLGIDFGKDSLFIAKSLSDYWTANPKIWKFSVLDNFQPDSIFQFMDSAEAINSLNQNIIYLIDKDGKIRLKTDGMNILFTSNILTNISTLLRKEHE